jgi:bacterioferritin-associated ferredoxin
MVRGGRSLLAPILLSIACSAGRAPGTTDHLPDAVPNKGGSTGMPGMGGSSAAAQGGGAGNGPGGAGGTGGSGGTSGSGAASGGADPTPLPDETTLFGARLRRLTSREYVATMTAVLGIPPSSGGIADDVRQNGYARNEAQVVDAVTAAGIAEAAEALAAAAVQDLSAVVPCGTEDEACAREFIAEFTRKAYRRPASESEVERLVSVYVAGADEGFAGGIELVIAAVLQSPQFLYHFEIGATPGPAEARARLTSHEVAESLAYLFTGAPPDPELAAAADAGSLYDAAARAAEARRLLTTAAARPQLELMGSKVLKHR